MPRWGASGSFRHLMPRSPTGRGAGGEGLFSERERSREESQRNHEILRFAQNDEVARTTASSLVTCSKNSHRSSFSVKGFAGQPDSQTARQPARKFEGH